MLIPAGQWAQNEFGFAPLGDKRRNQRLVNIAQHLAAHPGGTLPQAFPHWAELKAAYRFFGQAGVSFQQILTPHLDRTRASGRQPGEYLSAKMLARSCPESFEAAASFGPEMLAWLEKKLGAPKGGWTNQNVMVAIARLGGFLARKHEGSPGWQTIWRGWQRLMWMCEGLETLQLK